MTGRELELKSLKRAAVKVKRKCVSGWMTATIIFLVLTLLLTPVSVAAHWADNLLATRFPGAFWALEGKDDNARFLTDPQPPAENQETVYNRLRQEAIVLLKNENNALPLAQTTVDCKGNGEKAASLQAALSEKGFSTGSGTAILLLTQAEDVLLQELSQKRAAGEIEKLILLWDTGTPVQPEALKTVQADGVLWTGGADVKTIAAILTDAAPSGALSYTAAYGANPAAGSIYTGYKYYETRYEDFAMGTEKTGAFSYWEQVAYPFGYGLSYTSFAYSQFQADYDVGNDCFTVTVTVTNTGSITAREIVQIYAQSPYTDYDRENGVEKPAVKLVGFAKTEALAPGASADVTVQVARRELAAYDAKGAGTYILDAGDYYLTAAADSHNAVNNILAAKGYTVESTQGRMDTDGDTAMTYLWTQNSMDIQSYRGAVANRFGDTETGVSRQDWEGSLSKASAILNLPQTQYVPGNYATVDMPTLGAKNGLKLYDMKGLAFDDPLWQTLLDQLTFDEMAKLMGDAYRWTMPVASVQAPGGCVGNLPAPLGESFLLAAFDAEGMYAMGWWAGNDAAVKGETALRCFGDSFEDSFLAGTLRTQQAKGIYAQGVNVLLCSEATLPWHTEQAAREQYLRAFQYTAEALPTTGIALTGPAKELLDLMRQEWGGNGMAVATDIPVADGVLSGITVFDGKLPYAQKDLSAYENDPVVVAAMRQACHHNLYALANSVAMDGIGEHTAIKLRVLPVMMLLWLLMGLCAAATVVFGILWGQGNRKWKRSQAYLNYQTLKVTLQEEEKPIEPEEIPPPQEETPMEE